MYAAVYGSTIVGGLRKHIANVIELDFNFAEKTFDFGSASASGICSTDLSEGTIFVINNDSGHQLFAGFLKNTKVKEDTTEISFSGDDFKKVFDTDVMLDFTQSSSPSHTLHDIFQMVCDAVASSKDPYISQLVLEFVIPADSTNTKEIADYSGQYIVVNAAKFLKVYLSYYGYYIKPSYSVVTDKLTFTFSKSSSNVVSIKLPDFTHEKTSNDIKTNKTIATIKFNTVSEEPSWVASDQTYYLSVPDNRGEMVGTELPPPEGYAPGFALKLMDGFSWALSNSAEYNLSDHKVIRYVPWESLDAPTVAPTLEECAASCGDASLYEPDAVVRVHWYGIQDGIIYMTPVTYVKPVVVHTSYYKLNEYTYLARPSMPEKVYTLGRDNNIYNGYAPDSLRIYPIVSKIFEASYMAEAQINAVYELVNNRYIENILINVESVDTPLDLSALELYTMIRVYDTLGAYKDIPISEKTTTSSNNVSSCVVKLGFKKTLLTEIIKNDIGVDSVVAKSGSGSTKVVNQKFIPWTEATEPDPNQYDTWFKPVAPL